MTDCSIFLTPKEAGTLAGLSKRQITNIINTGKLSASKNEAGNFLIHKAEFFRVFPNALNQQEVSNEEKSIKEITLELENKHLQERLREKERENEYLRSQLELYAREKGQMLEAITSQTRLLEYQGEKHKTKWRLFKVKG